MGNATPALTVFLTVTLVSMKRYIFLSRSFSNWFTKFRRKTSELYNKYYPIEVSNSIPLKDKIAPMERWWREAHDLIMGLGFHRSDIEAMVRETPLTYRSGAHEMVAQCEKNNIPVLVFSAGIAGTYCF